MSNLNIEQTIEHLFRHEAGKLLSALTRVFGTHNLELAEDVVQDILIKAFEQWKFKGVPDNPTAWLLKVAKNRALDIVRREKVKQHFAEEFNHLLKSEYSLLPTLNNVLNETEIADDQLRMMFVCCHPDLPQESQIALILKTLCGFSIAEIARAYLSNEETITKRLYRAKQIFREQKVQFVLPNQIELKARLENVLTAIYLLFNEGYNATQNEELIRQDLIAEALRLGKLLIDNDLTRRSEALALLALMCFHTARIPARLDAEGNILLLKDQNRKLWNQGLMQIGLDFLDAASEEQSLTKYHLEAGIAYEHCKAKTYTQTNWQNILLLYDKLYEMQVTPIIALNRAIVIAEIKGAKAGIEAISNIADLPSLENFYLLPATLGELHAQLKQNQTAKKHLEKALQLTKSQSEQNLLKEKIRNLGD